MIGWSMLDQIVMVFLSLALLSDPDEQPVASSESALSALTPSTSFRVGMYSSLTGELAAGQPSSRTRGDLARRGRVLLRATEAGY
jgi:hypothetical protein